MNLKKIRSLLVVGITLLMVTACNSIMDSYDNCLIDLSVRFIRQSPCDIKPTSIDDLENLLILSFDEDGKLVNQSRIDKFNSQEPQQVLLHLPEKAYRVYVWTGLLETFSIENIKTEDDILFQLNQAYLDTSSSNLSPIYFGQFLVNEVLRVDKEENIEIKLEEITNRITVDLELDQSIEDKDIKDFEVILKSANGEYKVNGEMPLPQDQLMYIPQTTFLPTSSSHVYHLLDLKMGYFNDLIIKDKKSGEIIYEGDLIGSILMKNYNLNLDCVNDFKLKLVIADKCKDCQTYMCVKIIVNDWVIFSNDVELGGFTII